jgi:probable O-glycosylation ligase (exosortase A-associated)
MKPITIMLVSLILGVFGSLFRTPAWGLIVYYAYSVLRPQFLWEWALPAVPWSSLVGWTVLLCVVVNPPRLPAGLEARGGGARLTWAHRLVLGFGCWLFLTYVTARHPEVSYPYLIEYIKIFLMFLVGAFVLRTVGELWALYLMTGGILGYIAVEVNDIYLRSHYLTLFRRGYCGLDNNGAGLMLAMGVPMCFYAWEGMTSRWRWLFLALIPPLLHAVLTSYSRGAMLALIPGVLFWLVRSRHKVKVAVLLVGIACMIPVLAGKEIQERFESTADYNADDSARARFTTWKIAWRMAQENPIFGLGIRNSNIYTFDYGADIPGRTIHSQYLQTAADSGLVALALYLTALFVCWRTASRVMRDTRYRTDVEGRRAYAMAAGYEGSMIVFCAGAAFLSLETFETPYIMMLIAAQLPLVLRPAPAVQMHSEVEAACPDGAFIPEHDFHGIAPAEYAADPGALQE